MKTLKIESALILTGIYAIMSNNEKYEWLSIADAIFSLVFFCIMIWRIFKSI